MFSARASFNEGFHVSAPASGPTLSFSTTGGSLSTGVYSYAISYVTSIGETNLGVVSTDSAASNTSSCTLTSIPISGDVQVTARKIYRTAAGGATYGLITTLNDNGVTTYVDTLADGSRGPAPVVLATADPTLGRYGISYCEGLQKASVSTVTGATGSTDVTCNGSFLKLTYTAVTTAAQSSESSIVTNNCVSSSSIIQSTINSNGGTLATNGLPSISISDIDDGAFTINFINNHATNALTGEYIVVCSIIN